MPEDIERAYIMNQITSSEMQANLKQMDGAGAYNRVIEIINAAPAADVAQVRHGRWEEIRDAYGNLEGWLHTNCGRGEMQGKILPQLWSKDGPGGMR